MLSGANLTSPRTEWLLTPLTDPVSGGKGGDAAYILGPHKLILNNVGQASWQGPQYPNATEWDTWKTYVRSKSSLATETLLENTDGVLHQLFSRGGSLQYFYLLCADGRPLF